MSYIAVYIAIVYMIQNNIKYSIEQNPNVFSIQWMAKTFFLLFSEKKWKNWKPKYNEGRCSCIIHRVQWNAKSYYTRVLRLYECSVNGEYNQGVYKSGWKYCAAAERCSVWEETFLGGDYITYLFSVLYVLYCVIFIYT